MMHKTHSFEPRSTALGYTEHNNVANYAASDWLLSVTCAEKKRRAKSCPGAFAMTEDPRPEMRVVDVASPSSGLPCAPTLTIGRGAPGRSLRRTPVGPSKKLNASFKSPSLSTHRGADLSVADLQVEIGELKKKFEDLNRQVAELISEGYTLEELDQHIDQLHEYNDIKDVGQILLGKLAVVRGVTIKDLYSEFGLELDD